MTGNRVRDDRTKAVDLAGLERVGVELEELRVLRGRLYVDERRFNRRIGAGVRPIREVVDLPGVIDLRAREASKRASGPARVDEARGMGMDAGDADAGVLGGAAVARRRRCVSLDTQSAMHGDLAVRAADDRHGRQCLGGELDHERVRLRSAAYQARRGWAASRLQAKFARKNAPVARRRTAPRKFSSSSVSSTLEKPANETVVISSAVAEKVSSPPERAAAASRASSAAAIAVAFAPAASPRGTEAFQTYVISRPPPPVDWSEVT